MDDRGSWTATEKKIARNSNVSWPHAHWLCFTYFSSKSKSLIFKQIRQRYSTAVCQSSTEKKSEKREERKRKKKLKFSMNNGIAMRMIHHQCVCVRNARASDVCNCGHNQNKTQNHAKEIYMRVRWRTPALAVNFVCTYGNVRPVLIVEQ